MLAPCIYANEIVRIIICRFVCIVNECAMLCKKLAELLSPIPNSNSGTQASQYTLMADIKPGDDCSVRLGR